MRELSTGDAHDDDARIFDEYVQQNTEPPHAPEDAPAIVPDFDIPVIPNRALTGNVKIDAAWQPFMALPDDVDRTLLILSISPNANDPVYFGSTRAAVQSRNGFRIEPGSQPIPIPGYTGAVWLYAPDATAGAPFPVSWIAVTAPSNV